jgi:hypothetical protein
MGAWHSTCPKQTDWFFNSVKHDYNPIYGRKIHADTFPAGTSLKDKVAALQKEALSHE